MSRSLFSRSLYLVILVLTLPYTFSWAQDGPDYVVSTNRPNQTDAIGVLAPGLIQLEAGIGYSGFSNNFSDTDILFLPSTQIRIGIIKRVELNVFYDYNHLKTTSSFGEATLSNNFLTLGSKISLWNENGIVPQATGVVNLHYSNFGNSIDDWDGEVRLILQNTISSRFALAYMLRLRHDLGIAINPSYSITENVSAFLEYYFGTGGIEDGINLGLGYLVNNRLTLDIMYGTLFTSGLSNSTITTGIGWWIK